jgi:hypothetical protein
MITVHPRAKNEPPCWREEKIVLEMTTNFCTIQLNHTWTLFIWSVRDREALSILLMVIGCNEYIYTMGSVMGQGTQVSPTHASAQTL